MDVGSSERARKLFERVIDIVTSDIVQGRPNSVLHTPPPHRDTPVDPCPISMCILHGYSFYNLCLSISILTPVANGRTSDWRRKGVTQQSRVPCGAVGGSGGNSAASEHTGRRFGDSSFNSAEPEYSRLFGFNSKSGGKRKRSGSTRTKVSCSVEKKKYWNHECVCLARRNDNTIPSPQEKMDLAELGLGLKRLAFDCNASQREIDSVIYDAFPQLSTRGYELLRTASKRKNLVVIKTPPDGMTVLYLRDLLQQSKLFLRPTLEDIQVNLNLHACACPYYVCVYIYI